MSFFHRTLSPAPRISAEAIERALAAVAAQIEPDPLFRRHLRSEVVNRYVATREGLVAPERAAPDRRSRTGRLGRACLYASFSLAATAASVLAAAQEALPGDALYGVKLRVEELRFDVVPDHLHADLVAYALGERIEEMDHLIAAGDLDEAVGLVPAIEHEFARLEALMSASDADEARIERHLVVLSGLLDRLPDAAQSAVEDVVNGVNGLSGQSDDSSSSTNPNSGPASNAGAGGSDATGSTPAGGQGPSGTTNIDEEPPAPDRTPEATPQQEPTQSSERTPRPEPTIKPAPPNGPSDIEDDQD